MAAIPHVFSGKNVVATAQTGTGKTLAFLVPVMDKLMLQTESRRGALGLVPTRELSLQIGRQYDHRRGKKLPPAALLIGGVAEKSQLSAVRAGANVIIATPV